MKGATRIAGLRICLLLVVLLRRTIIIPALRGISCNNRWIGSMFQMLQIALMAEEKVIEFLKVREVARV